MADDSTKSIHTDGGASVEGNVNTQGGSFIGRDKVEVNIYPHFEASPKQLRRSFDHLIEDKLHGFVGRQFVFEALDNFINTHDSGYFIIRGVCGIGKSALLAKLINNRGYIHHFNIASQNIRSAKAFLENACAQIIARYGLKHTEIPHRAVEDSGFLIECLNEATANQNNRPIVLVIDALDEADRLGLTATTNLFYLPTSLPKGVYFVLTTRDVHYNHLSFIDRQTLDLEANSAGNLQDISEYIETFSQRKLMLERISNWGINQAQFVAGLRKKSQGNFMYLRYVLPAIENGKFIHGTLDELPDGLMAYYERHWRKMSEGNKEEFFTVTEPIVSILGVVQEPVTIRQIASWLKIDEKYVRISVQKWWEFLEKDTHNGEKRYRIYHASFQDFLKDQVDLVRYDEIISEYYLTLAGLGGNHTS